MGFLNANTPEMEPSKMPAIVVAAFVGLLCALILAATGIKGGLQGLISFLIIVGTYKAARSSQFRRRARREHAAFVEEIKSRKPQSP